MDKEYKRQVDEFNILWHRMLVKSKDVEEKYPNLQGLSNNEIAIIRIISESQKEEVIIKDILEVLKLPKSTLTSIIDRLENRKFITRAISKRDRRSYKLELTEKGKITQCEHIKFEEEVYGKIITSLDTYEEREDFLRLIRKIAGNISK
jgi:DNA-binding MarR family transcriptional regulator